MTKLQRLANEAYNQIFQQDMDDYALDMIEDYDISSVEDLEEYREEFSAGQFDAIEMALMRV